MKYLAAFALAVGLAMTTACNRIETFNDITRQQHGKITTYSGKGFWCSYNEDDNNKLTECSTGIGYVDLSKLGHTKSDEKIRAFVNSECGKKKQMFVNAKKDKENEKESIKQFEEEQNKFKY